MFVPLDLNNRPFSRCLVRYAQKLLKVTYLTRHACIQDAKASPREDSQGCPCRWNHGSSCCRCSLLLPIRFCCHPIFTVNPLPPHRLAQCFALELLPWCDDRMCNEERLRIYTSLMVGLRAEQHSRAGLCVPQRSMWMHCQRAISELGVSYPSCSPEIRTGRFSEAWKPRDPEGCKGDNNESLGSVRGAARSQL